MGVSGREKDRHDHYFKKAKAEGYRARSVYKLREIQDHFHLMHPGMTVLDLGAAPGSWTQLVAEIVGTGGRVVSVDRTPLEGGLSSQVLSLAQDIFETPPETLQRASGRPGFDVVLSDMAPNTSGIRAVDQARSLALCQRVHEIAGRLLVPSGSMVCKVFQGPDLQGFVARVAGDFRTARLYKPKSSRNESVELFLVARGFTGVSPEIPDALPEEKPLWDPLSG